MCTKVTQSARFATALCVGLKLVAYGLYVLGLIRTRLWLVAVARQLRVSAVVF